MEALQKYGPKYVMSCAVSQFFYVEFYSRRLANVVHFADGLPLPNKSGLAGQIVSSMQPDAYS